MATWNAAFNASPAGGDNPSFGDDKIRELKTTLVDRWIKEHYFDISEGGSQPRQGLHRAGSAVAFYQNTAPTQRNGVNLAAADAGLLYTDSDDKNIKVWDGVSFENVKPAVAVLADSATNADTVDSVHVGSAGNTIRAIHGVLHSAGGYTWSTIFSALDEAVPNTNDFVPLTGGWSSTVGRTNVVSAAQRISASTIRITYVYSTSTATGVGNTDITVSSGGSPDYISMAW